MCRYPQASHRREIRTGSHRVQRPASSYNNTDTPTTSRHVGTQVPSRKSQHIISLERNRIPQLYHSHHPGRRQQQDLTGTPEGSPSAMRYSRMLATLLLTAFVSILFNNNNVSDTAVCDPSTVRKALHHHSSSSCPSNMIDSLQCTEWLVDSFDSILIPHSSVVAAGANSTELKLCESNIFLLQSDRLVSNWHLALHL